MTNQNQLIRVLAHLFCSSILLSCTLGRDKDKLVIPYPMPFPDSIAVPFLPGIVSTDSVDFGSAFSRDGKSFYFARSESKQSEIYVTHHDGENWSLPKPVSFNTVEYSEADPAFAPDGTFYFISNRPKNQFDSISDYDIWFVRPLKNGKWTEPEIASSLNSDSSEFYISFAENGNLYFASSRKGGFGEEDIYVSRWSHQNYLIPENVGATVNSNRSEYDPSISCDEELLVFTSPNRDDSFGMGDLYVAKRSNGNDWLPIIHLGKNVNTSTREYCAYFSPDSKYFFFSSEGNVKWMDVRFLLELHGRL